MKVSFLQNVINFGYMYPQVLLSLFIIIRFRPPFEGWMQWFASRLSVVLFSLLQHMISRTSLWCSLSSLPVVVPFHVSHWSFPLVKHVGFYPALSCGQNTLVSWSLSSEWGSSWHGSVAGPLYLRLSLSMKKSG